MLGDAAWYGALLVATAVAADAVLRWLVEIAPQRIVLDIPNSRSLHQQPTPRGGGLAIVLVVLAIQAIAYALLPLAVILAMTGWTAAAGLAFIGWYDDRHSLSPSVRLLAQLLVASGCVIAVGQAIGLVTDLVGVCVGAVSVIAFVWLINLYNFMDGSDGLAGTQAFTAAFCGGLLALLQGNWTIAVIASAIAGGCAGFLRWNWAPAKIFMGDVGSYFLGAEFGFLILYTTAVTHNGWYWLILLSPFITDASLTLLRRMLHVKDWYAAHKTHVYQLLIQSGRSHAQVAVAVGAFVMFVAGPCAWFSVRIPSGALAATIATYGLTATIWFYLHCRVHSDGDSA